MTVEKGILKPEKSHVKTESEHNIIKPAVVVKNRVVQFRHQQFITLA